MTASVAPAGLFDRGRRVAALLSLLVCASPSRATAAAPSLTEGQLRWVTPLLESSRATRPLWPGYSPLFMPVLLHFEGLSGAQSGVSVLLGHPAPPAGFAPVPGLPDTAVKRDDRLTMTASWGVSELGGIPVFLWRVSQGEDAHARLPTLVHENFHVYQSSGLKAANAIFAGSATWNSARLDESADAMIESSLLARAVTDPERDPVAAREFSTLRSVRRANNPDAARWEDYQEFQEGMAALVDTRFFSETLAGDSRGGPVSRDGVAVKLLTGFSMPDTGFKRRYYGSGAAMALLLDRRGVDWVGRLSRGTSLFSMFLEQFPPLSGPEDVSAGLRRRHRHGSLRAALAAHHAASAAARDRLTKLFDDKRTVLLTLNLDDWRTQAGSANGSIVTYDDGSWGGDSSSTEMPWDGTFSLKLFEAATKTTPGPPHIERILLGPAEEVRVKIDGSPASTGSESPFRDLEIISPKAHLRMAVPGILRRSGRTLSLDVPAKAARP